MAAAPDDPRLDLFGYARLVGEGLDYVVRKREVVLGRASKTAQADVVLGDNMNISRQHARIVYNLNTKAFELVVLGKNGVTVGSTLYTPTSQPCSLKSQDVLAVGEKVFFFLLPKPVEQLTKRDLELLSPHHPMHKRPRPNPALPNPTTIQPAPLVGADGSGTLQLLLPGGGGAAPQPLLARGPPGMLPASVQLPGLVSVAAAAQGQRLGPGLPPLAPAGSSGFQVLQQPPATSALPHTLHLGGAIAPGGSVVNGALDVLQHPPLG